MILLFLIRNKEFLKVLANLRSIDYPFFVRQNLIFGNNLFYYFFCMKKYFFSIVKNVLLQIVSLSIIVWLVAFAAWTNIATKSNGQVINADSWNELVDNINNIGSKVDNLSVIPPWAVIAFNLSSCPSGWIAADGTSGTPDLRGEFIRGLDNGRWVDTGRILASSQLATKFPRLSIYSYSAGSAILVSHAVNSNPSYPNDSVAVNVDSTETATASAYASVALSPTGATSWGRHFTSRPRNVALLYCVKQ